MIRSIAVMLLLSKPGCMVQIYNVCSTCGDSLDRNTLFILTAEYKIPKTAKIHILPFITLVYFNTAIQKLFKYQQYLCVDMRPIIATWRGMFAIHVSFNPSRPGHAYELGRHLIRLHLTWWVPVNWALMNKRQWGLNKITKQFFFFRRSIKNLYTAL